MQDQFSRVYSLLQIDEQKKCNTYFSTQGEKEKMLFSELRKLKPRTAEELAVKIYGDGSKAATLRQLRKHVTDKFVHFVRDKIVPTGEARYRIRRLLDFTDFLIARQSSELALEYLLEAEKEATEARSWQLLDTIFEYKLSHAVALGIDASEAYAQWERNSKLYHSLMHVEAARNILTAMLHDYRKQGRVPKQADLMKAFYERFNPNEEERANAAFMYSVAQMFRRVMLSTKDYWRIEEAVGEIYQHLLHKNAFGPEDQGIHRSFLLMLAQACYRNRNFDQAESYVLEAQRMLAQPVQRNHPGYAKMVSLKAAIYTYTNRCEQAGDLLRKHLYGPEPIENEQERANMQLNLAVNYFCQQDYQRAQEQLGKLHGTDRDYLDLQGVEWVYKKRMIAMIVQFELHQFEVAEEQLQKLTQDFEAFLNQDLFARARMFMEFVLRWFQNHDLIRNIDFHKEIRDAQLGWGDREDIQAILFFSWLRAHMLGKSFYSTFLARLAEEGKDWDYPFGLKD